MFSIKSSSDALLFTILASRIGFFIAGFGLAIWAPLVPYVRLHIPMSNATFGLMLLCIGRRFTVLLCHFSSVTTALACATACLL